MLQKSIGTGILALGTVLGTGTAVATPPYGVAWMEDLARGPAVGSATVAAKPGTGAFVGTYALEPGSASGWRQRAGTSFLAVTSGTVRVVQAPSGRPAGSPGASCAVREYTAPEVAVLPAGKVHVSNAGGGSAKFVGFFDNAPKASRPLLDGREAAAPKGCAAGGSHRAASAGLTVTGAGQGTYIAAGTGGGPDHHVDVAKRLAVAEGGDVVLLKGTALPGTSRGWSRHGPAMAIVTRGQLDTYVPTDSGCAKVQELRAGDAGTHSQYTDHVSMVSGNEPVELVLVYWGMGNNRVPMPGLVDFVEANDFTPMLPAGCTVL